MARLASMFASDTIGTPTASAKLTLRNRTLGRQPRSTTNSMSPNPIVTPGNCPSIRASIRLRAHSGALTGRPANNKMAAVATIATPPAQNNAHTPIVRPQRRLRRDGSIVLSVFLFCLAVVVMSLLLPATP